MAKKYSSNPIPGLDADWGNDPNVNLPYSGEAVLTFIKENLKDLQTNKVDIDDLTAITEQLSKLNPDSIISKIELNGLMLDITYANSATDSINLEELRQVDENDQYITVDLNVEDPIIGLGKNTYINLLYHVRKGSSDQLQSSDPSAGSATVTLTVLVLGKSQGTRIISGLKPETLMTGSPGYSLETLYPGLLSLNKATNITVRGNVEYSFPYEDEETKQTITKTKTRFIETTIQVTSLILKTSYSIVNTGYSASSTTTVNITPVLSGPSGEKIIRCYVNGVLLENTFISGTSASLTGNLNITLPSSINTGEPINILLIGEYPSLDLHSNLLYFDVFKTSSSKPVICLMIDSENQPFTSTYKSPNFNVELFSDFSFNYYLYNPSSVTAPISINTTSNATTTSSKLTVNRTLQNYTKTIKESGSIVYSIESEGATARTFSVNIIENQLMPDLQVSSQDLALYLDATGRSNSEENPAQWNYGEYSTTFTGFNWDSNGWRDNTLAITGGAKAEINYPLFSLSPESGLTIEVEYMVQNASSEDLDVISASFVNANDKRAGLVISTQKAGFYTGGTSSFVQDNGDIEQKDTFLGLLYPQEVWYKFAITIDTVNNLYFIYLNGKLSGAEQESNHPVINGGVHIILDSAAADVYVKNVRIYNRCLTPDECVDSYIVDRNTTAEIIEQYKENDVLSSDRSMIDFNKIILKGKGVMLVEGNGTQDLITLNGSENKKEEFKNYKVRYVAPTNIGHSQDFIIENALLTIQGTTSTKRPRKNYRVYFYNKSEDPDKLTTCLFGEEACNAYLLDQEAAKTQYGVTDKNLRKYSVRAGDPETPILCLKADYVDSSCTHNTGGAVLWDQVTKRYLNSSNLYTLRNAAQNYQVNVQGKTEPTYRTAIDGYPIDVFAVDSIVDPQEITYIGMYNLNNDKSKSHNVFGFDINVGESGVYDIDDSEKGTNIDEWNTYNKIDTSLVSCYEMLNNGNSLDLFLTYRDASDAVNVDEQASYDDEFDSGVEDRYPDNGSWAEGLPTKSSQRIAKFKRLYNWISDCAYENGLFLQKVDGNVVYSDTYLKWLDNFSETKENWDDSPWISLKFQDEVSQYFNVDNLCAWYIWTDYNMAVDQRAKNMMLYTMDGDHWMFQYYDGDTVLGLRNDCFLAYDYTLEYNTYDYDAGQFGLQGHNSWLWALVRANLQDRLRIVADNMRKLAIFSTQGILDAYNVTEMSNWCARQYNHSQYYRYVLPWLANQNNNNDIRLGGGSNASTKFLATIHGSREAHRTYTIQKHSMLMDGKYVTSSFGKNKSLIYGNDVNTSQSFTVTSPINCYVGHNTANTSTVIFQVVANVPKEIKFNGQNGANNPLEIAGLENITRIVANNLYLNPRTHFDTATDLQYFEAHDQGELTKTDNTSLGLGYCTLLKEIDVSNSSLSGDWDLSRLKRLEKLNISNTSISTLKLPDGGIINKLYLTTNLSTIHFNNLQYLTPENLDIPQATFVKLNKLILNNCPNIQEKVLSGFMNDSTVSASNKRLRVTGVELRGPIEYLDKFWDYLPMDANGQDQASDGKYSVLVGTMSLTQMVDDDILQKYQKHFPELQINLPEYTVVIQAVDAPTRYSLTNLDNNTGYLTDTNTPTTNYVSSGHIKKITDLMHRYLCKITKMNKMKTVTFDFPGATYDTDETPDNSGAMAILQMSDENPVQVKNSGEIIDTDTDFNNNWIGEYFIKFPKYYYKGVYDSINRYFYYVISSNTTKPKLPDYIVTLSGKDCLYGLDKALIYSKNATLSSMILDYEYYTLYKIPLVHNGKTAQLVNTPITFNGGSEYFGYAFTDDSNQIISASAGITGTNDAVTSSVLTVPDGSTYLYVTLRNLAQSLQDKSYTLEETVIHLHLGLTGITPDLIPTNPTFNGDLFLPDMEDWFENEEAMLSVSPGLLENGIFSLPLNCTSNSVLLNQDISTNVPFVYNRGFQFYDYDMGKNLGNLIRLSRGDIAIQQTGYSTNQSVSDAINADFRGIRGIAYSGRNLHTVISVNPKTNIGYEFPYNMLTKYVTSSGKSRTLFINKKALDVPVGTRGNVGNRNVSHLSYNKYCDCIRNGVSSTTGTTTTYYYGSRNFGLNFATLGDGKAMFVAGDLSYPEGYRPIRVKFQGTLREYNTLNQFKNQTGIKFREQ